jgi:hypothetical protein
VDHASSLRGADVLSCPRRCELVEPRSRCELVEPLPVEAEELVNEASAVGLGTGEAAPSGSPGVRLAGSSICGTAAGEFYGLRITPGNSKAPTAPWTDALPGTTAHTSACCPSYSTARTTRSRRALEKNLVGPATGLPR